MLFRRSPHALEKLSKELRQLMLDTTYIAGSAHIGGALSVLDIIVALYNSPDLNFEKDHFILSAGHLCLAHYAVLSKIHHISEKQLQTFTQLGSIFQGHESTDVPGVEFSSGSLGQGLSFAAGLALGDKDSHVVCVTSDGEHNEGQIWEALMFANKYHLGNIINVVDYNGIQIDGKTEDIMPLGELAAKYLRFGWTVTTVDGHDFTSLLKTIKQAKNSTIYPACIIAKTTFGKGISYMENNSEYHHIKNLSDKLYQLGLEELS
ncbi:transketolase [Candidatus Shapirobacteria bacterium]|nr:transketolase [Candidatus Shapirobacteria bacterium]